MLNCRSSTAETLFIQTVRLYILEFSFECGQWSVVSGQTRGAATRKARSPTEERRILMQRARSLSPTVESMTPSLNYMSIKQLLSKTISIA